VIVEIELGKFFKQNNKSFYHTIPSTASYPYTVFDRIGTPKTYPMFGEVSFALDVYGKNLEQVLTSVDEIKTMFEALVALNDKFSTIDVYNTIDNSNAADEVKYTMYVRFIFRNA
jgi:hypothetical protein